MKQMGLLALRHTGTAPLGSRPDGACNEHHAGQSRDPHRHTLWWDYAFTLAVYVAQVGGPAVIAIGLWYVLGRTD